MLKIRVLSTVMSIAMLSSVITVPAAHASEDDVLRVTAEPAIVKCGDDFTYVLSMDSLDGVAAIQASLRYDDDVFEYKSNEFSGGFTLTKCDAGNGIINIAAASAEDFEFSGEFLRIDFTVRDTARTGKYSLEPVGDVIIAKGNDGDTASVDIQTVTVDNADHAVFSFNCENTKVDENREAEYTVKLSGLNGIQGYQAEFYYDDEKFDIVSVEPSDESATVKYADGVIGIAQVFDKGGDDGVDLDDYPVGVIKLKAPNECPNGKYTPFSAKSIIVSLNGNEKEADLSCGCTPIIVGYDTAVTMHAVPSKHSVRVGDELTYSLDIDSELECNGMQTVFSYDPDILTFTGNEETIDGELINQEGANKEINISDGAIGIACGYEKAVTMNGNLATLSFRVKSDAQTGDVAAQIGETLFAGDNGENINVELERDVGPVSVSEETGVYDLTLTANRTKIMPGETVDVTIAIPKVENLYAAELTITYDTSLFEPLKDKEQTGDVYNAALMSAVSYNYKEKVGVWISYPSAHRYSGGGDVVTFKFKAKEGANATGNFALNVESSTPELTAPAPVRVRSTTDNPAQSVIDAIEAAAAAVDAADKKVDEVVINGVGTIVSAGEELEAAKSEIDAADTAVNAAESAYESLDDEFKYYSEEAKKRLDEEIKDKLTGVKAKYDEKQTEYEQLEEANASGEGYIKRVNDLKTEYEKTNKITRDNYTAIKQALDKAEDYYGQMNSQAKDERKFPAVATAHAEYEAILSEYNKFYTDLEAATAIEKRIDAIGDITLDNYESKKRECDDISMALSGLTEEQQSLVGNKEKLSEALAAYANCKEKDEKVKAVMALIEEIDVPSITLASETQINKAREAYEKLDETDAALKDRVTNYDKLLTAEQRIEVLKTAQKDAARVDELISAIGDVTLDSGTDIRNARTAYDELSPEAKGFVQNLDVLTDAEVKYAELVSDDTDRAAVAEVVKKIEAIGEVTLEKEQAIQDARAAYEDLTDTQKLLVPSEEYAKLTDAETELERLKREEIYKAEAQRVCDLIEAIGEVTLDKAEQIRTASEAYSSLSDDEKKYVPAETLTKLTNAVSELEALESEEEDKKAAAVVDQKISAIGEVTLEKEEMIKAAREAYDALTDAQKDYVTKLEELTAAEAALAELNKLEYTADYEIDGKGKLKVTARKYKSDGTAVLVTAIYKDDVLQNVHIENIAETRAFEFTYDCERDSTVKLMLWNNLAEMRPVTESISK